MRFCININIAMVSDVSHEENDPKQVLTFLVSLEIYYLFLYGVKIFFDKGFVFTLQV